MSTNPPRNVLVVQDNESAVSRSLASGNFVQAYLLVHALTESLLRAVLGHSDNRLSFSELIDEYKTFLDQNKYPFPTFMNELVRFNRRRNRIVHQLWQKGFTETNAQTELAAHAAVKMYSLLMEWFDTFDDSIGKKGFNLTH